MTDKQVKWLKGELEADIALVTERYKESNQKKHERNSAYWYGRRDGLESASKVLSRMPSAEELEEELEKEANSGDRVDVGKQDKDIPTVPEAV